MVKTKSRLNNDIINASEIGQFNYCSIAWFLQRSGYKPLSEHLDSGIKVHKNLGNIIEYTNFGTLKSKLLSYIGLILFIIGILIILFEVII